MRLCGRPDHYPSLKHDDPLARDMMTVQLHATIRFYVV